MADNRTIISIAEAEKAIAECRVCEEALGFEPRPVAKLSNRAKLLIIGQAPGTRVHETGIPWNDRSGDRLREWLALGRDDFYNPDLVALMPMGFCFPGQDAKGGDLPPRPECAPLWHDLLLGLMPQVELILLVGSYAQKRYLKPPSKQTMTETVRQAAQMTGRFFALPHPSWRNMAWIKKNPWFNEETLPALKQRLSALNLPISPNESC